MDIKNIYYLPKCITALKFKILKHSNRFVVLPFYPISVVFENETNRKGR